jgi:tight adherence protein C
MNISAEYLPILVSGAVFFSLVLAIAGIAIYTRTYAKKQTLLGKIKQDAGRTAVMASEVIPKQTRGGILDRVLNFLGDIGERAQPFDKLVDYTKMRPVFLKAGIRRENARSVYWGAKLLLAFFPAFLVFLYRVLLPGAPMSTVQMVVLLGILAILGYYLPDLWLQLKISRRKEEILNGFPDALDLLVVCVEAGMGLDSAINRVAKEIELDNKVLSGELKLYNLEMRAGKLRKDALRNLAMRTDLEEVNNLATLLIQTDKFGTSVGQALKVYSDTMRTQRFQRAEERAAKIPVKLIFPLILFIFPSLFVAILGPAMINIYKVFIKGAVLG